MIPYPLAVGTGILKILPLFHKKIKVEILDIQIHQIEEYKITRNDFSGDLTQFLPVDESFVEKALFLQPRYERNYQYLVSDDEDIKITEIDNSDLPSAVIFRDSFMNALRPFLSDCFSRAVYKSGFTIDLDLIEEEAPDVVIFEIAQRYLYELLDD
ncbi:MAG: hypothetical protein MUO76_08490 [Anaerolineaceae bacterium]|nr:hypothetical protein [Anaerolineaceae bacterium]